MEDLKEEVKGGETPQEANDKVSKQFDANFKKLVAMLGGEKALKKVSVPADELGDVVKELLADRRKTFIIDFKTKAVALLDKKLEFDKECRKAEEAYKNTVLAKKKEFSEQMKIVFGMVENMQEIEKSYYASMKGTQPEGEKSSEEPKS